MITRRLAGVQWSLRSHHILIFVTLAAQQDHHDAKQQT
jgi:hypothetical protein